LDEGAVGKETERNSDDEEYLCEFDGAFYDLSSEDEDSVNWIFLKGM
jgi:hypothetical protein